MKFLLFILNCSSGVFLEYKENIFQNYSITPKVYILDVSCNQMKINISKQFKKLNIYMRSISTDRQIISTNHVYNGNTKGLLFKTQYEEHLSYVVEFIKQEKCHIIIYGLVCEKPIDSDYECMSLSNTIRAENKVKELVNALTK